MQRPGQFTQWLSFVMAGASFLFALGLGFSTVRTDPAPEPEPDVPLHVDFYNEAP